MHTVVISPIADVPSSRFESKEVISRFGPGWGRGGPLLTHSGGWECPLLRPGHVDERPSLASAHNLASALRTSTLRDDRTVGVGDGIEGVQ